MKQRLISIVIPFLVGAVAIFFSYDAMELYQDLNLPPFAPPSYIFPIAWSILYFLMGYASYDIYKSHHSQRETALILYIVQLVFNFAWPILFFRFQNYFLAWLDLIALIIILIFMIRYFYRIHQSSAYLNIPYLIWSFFALYLNFYIFLYN